MPRKASSYPTDFELAILQALWAHGPASVGVVHNAIKKQRTSSYSTTLKMIQVMYDKGLLVRDESVRPHLYRPAASQEETQLRLLDDLIQKAFGGVASRMLVRALSPQRISTEELAEIKRHIEQLEEERGES